MPKTQATQALETSGRFWPRGFFTQQDIKEMRAICQNQLARFDSATPLAKFIGGATKLGQAIQDLGYDPQPTRITQFQKQQGQNWSLPWHQDRVILVQEKHDVDGYTNWSKKGEAWHCEPPIEILENTIFIRIHLDPQTDENGPMQIALGSHKFGKIPEDDIQREVANLETESCLAQSGDVLIVKGMLWHRSNISQNNLPRHVLRVDYAKRSLLDPALAWGLC